MKILLIAPASGNWKTVGRNRLFNGKTFRFSMLSLLSVAAETPPGAEIRIVDEQIDNIPWDEKFDLVGITCMTALAPRAYELASRFRTLGIPVVLGGMHPTFCPNEALQHGDAVVAGEAEGIWPKVVEDAQNGCLGGIYRSNQPVDLSSLKKLHVTVLIVYFIITERDQETSVNHTELTIRKITAVFPRLYV